MLCTPSKLFDADRGVPVADEIREGLLPCKLPLQTHACIFSLATDNDVSPEVFKESLIVHEALVHICASTVLMKRIK